MGSDMDNMDANVIAAAADTIRSSSRDRIQGSCDNHGRDVAYRHSIDRVDDMRTAGKLDAALEHAKKKVVGIADTSSSISKDIARSDDRSKEAASASLADELFRDLWCVRTDVTCEESVCGGYLPIWTGRIRCRDRCDCPSCHQPP